MVTQLLMDAECCEGSVTVEAIDDAGDWTGVRLGWSAGPVVLGTDLDCAGARELAERIEVAMARADQTGGNDEDS